MAYKIELDLDGTIYRVEQCSFSTHQMTDYKTNKPNSAVSPSTISMDLDVDGKLMKDIWVWAKDDRMKKNGTMNFKDIENDAATYTMKFKEGVCTAFSFAIGEHSGDDMSVHVEVAAKEVTIMDETIAMDWK
jgi:hypothetical protein